MGKTPSEMRCVANDLGTREFIALQFPSEGGHEAGQVDNASQDSANGQGPSGNSGACIVPCAGPGKSLRETGLIAKD
jgi:hypothetical protein